MNKILLKSASKEAKASIIKIRGLTNKFGIHLVHNKLNLDVVKGEIIGIVGGSGTGKSVLMRSIIGLQHPVAGSVEIFDDNFLEASVAARRAIQQRVGVLFQDGALFSAMTVEENIMVPLREKLNISDQLAHEIAAMKISISGLPTDAAKKYPAELSGGMRKRAGLARALALDPEIVFLDEPTAGLDPIGAARFDELILNLNDTLGITVFMITHDVDSLHRVCDRVAVLANGVVVTVGPLEAVKKFDHDWVHSYFSGPRGRAAQNAIEEIEPTNIRGLNR